MLKINVLKIEKNIPFQMYLLSDRLVKKLNKEFELYNVKFYRDVTAKEPTILMDYPCGNVYWYTDFKKFIKSEILSKDFMVDYDEIGSIGKRYRRQDEIGTPYCITYDFESENDNCVTVRSRDTMLQERISICKLSEYISKKCEF